MPEDIAPALLDAIRQDFERNLGGRQRAVQLLEKIQAGGANYADAGDYAEEVGTALADAFRANLSSAVLPDGRMYYNIADRVVRPLLEQDHALVAEAAQTVQQSLNTAAGLGLKPQAVPLNESRVQGLLDKISNAEQYDTVAWVLGEPVKNFSRAIVDESIRRNVDFQGGAGLRPRVIRRVVANCCRWCGRLAGTYTYPDVPQEVYQRHEYCRCTVEYDPGDGRRQNVHTKQWTDPNENVKILERRLVGLRTNNVTIRSVSEHVKQRMTERSVPVDSIQDAIENPLKIGDVKYDKAGRPSFSVTGLKATLAVNPDTGVIVTCYPTHSRTREKLLEELKEK